MRIYPKDIWNGDDPGFLDGLFKCFPEYKNDLFGKEDIKFLDENDFGCLLCNPEKLIEHRLFPRNNIANSLASIMSIIRHFDKFPEGVGKKIIIRISSAMPKEILSNELFSKILSSLDISPLDISCDEISGPIKIIDKSVPKDISEDSVTVIDNSKPKTISEKDIEDIKEELNDEDSVPIDKDTHVILNDKEVIKEACRFFSDKDIFDIDARILYSAHKKLAEKIEELDLSKDFLITPDIDNVKLAISINSRKKYVDFITKKVYDNLLQESDKLGALKTAAVLAEFDIKYGLDSKWDKEILNPSKSVFSHEKKSEFVFVTNEDGLKITGNDLIKMVGDDSKINILKKYLDEGVVDNFKNNPIEVFKNMIYPHKHIVVKTYFGLLDSGDNEEENVGLASMVPEGIIISSEE